MSAKKIRVGIIGLKPHESWAGIAHVPALRSMPEEYDIVGVANSNVESSKQACSELNIPLPFANADELIHSPDVDLVTVTITVPQHLNAVKAAIAAGKHIYCEAPLGNGLEEAKILAELAKDKAIKTAVGLQARVAPEILHLRTLIEEGSIGEVLSSHIIGWGGNWGQTAGNLSRLAYLLDRKNGATMLTIPVAHTLAAVRDVLGDIVEVSSMLDTRVKEVRSEEDGRILKMTAPDQILMNGKFKNGALFSVHYQGGMPNGTDGFAWDIHGTKGDIRVTAGFGHAQMAQLTVFASKAGEGIMKKIDLPGKYAPSVLTDRLPGNVAANYARLAHDIRTGSTTVSNFQDAVSIQTLIDTIERSAESGKRETLTASNRPLPITV